MLRRGAVEEVLGWRFGECRGEIVRDLEHHWLIVNLDDHLDLVTGRGPA